MIVRAIDSAGDWLFGKGKNDYKKNIEAVAQSIRTRLQSHLGDCFWAVDQGVDWFNLLGSKKRLELELVITSTILNTPEVTSLIEVLFSVDENRVMLIQYSVNTIYGVVSETTTQGV
jgi:hypothetical protein